MNSTLRSEIARHARSLGKRRRSPDRQVVAVPNGTPYTHYMLRPDIAQAVDACDEIPAHKKPKVTTHVLRHAAASLMARAGVPIFDIARVLGHETIQVTMRYAHFAPETGKAAVEALGDILDLDLDPDVDRDIDPGNGPDDDPSRIKSAAVGIDMARPRGTVLRDGQRTTAKSTREHAREHTPIRRRQRLMAWQRSIGAEPKK